MVSQAIRSRFGHTLVVHDIDLPHGKGWSPLAWQVLNGQTRIPVTLFEFDELVDNGIIYAQSHLEFQGRQLVEEIRAAQVVYEKGARLE